MDVYSHLFNIDDTEEEGFFDSFCNGLHRVSEETIKELEGPLTSEEVYMALQSMQGEKLLELMEFHKNFSKPYGLKWERMF